MPAVRTGVRPLALMLSLACGTASASQLDYTLYAGITHSDNVNLSQDQPISQNILAPGVNFTFTQQGSTIQANITGTLEYRDYLGGAFSNQKVALLSGQANWTVLPQRLDFTVQDFAGVQPLSTLSSDGPDNQQQTNVLVLGPTLYFRLGDTVHGQGELRYINSDASKTKEFNSSRGEAALRLYKELNATDQLSFNIVSQHVDFNNVTDTSGQPPGNSLINPDYSRNELFGRYASQLSRFRLDAALGWSQIDFHDAPSVSSSLLRLTLGWQATQRSSFSLAASRQYSDSAQDMILPAQTAAGTSAPVYRSPLSSVGIGTGDAVISNQVYLERRLQASYAFTSERFNFVVSPLYSKRTYLNDTSFDQSERGATAGLNYRLTERLSLRAAAETRRLDYQALQRRDRLSDYEVGLALRETPHWSYHLSLTRRQRSSNVPGEGYSANEIYFGVEFRR